MGCGACTQPWAAVGKGVGETSGFSNQLKLGPEAAKPKVMVLAKG